MSLNRIGIVIFLTCLLLGYATFSKQGIFLVTLSMNSYVNFSIFVLSFVALGVFTLFNFQKVKNNEVFRDYMRTKAILFLISTAIILFFLGNNSLGKKQKGYEKKTENASPYLRAAVNKLGTALRTKHRAVYYFLPNAVAKHRKMCPIIRDKSPIFNDGQRNLCS